jgi:hypothetical protein
MALKSLTFCEWDGPHCESTHVPGPRWEDVSEAICRLDNSHFNDVYLQRDEDPEHFWLCIGGGAGRYLITGAAEEGQYPTVLDPTHTGVGKVELLLGGQIGLYPVSWIQDLETALKAAKRFYEHGDFGGDLHWEKP